MPKSSTYNSTTSSLSTLAQNNTITNSSFMASYNNTMKETLRTGRLTENSPEIFCKFQPNGFDCDESGIFTPRFYYDVKMESCKTFYFGQCRFDQNKFDRLLDCHDTCLDSGKQDIPGTFPANVYCKFQPEFGKCNDYFPMWYYDVSSRECRGFSYSGCGGNLNRFATHLLCVKLCNILTD
ncbi:thrombin inhibitor hemalin-like [Epargyreus clarus]|uniref:thrombin inhibitor hemalin-like n=1 Tax=Epargyreus clarus TaxID=520877 RepID=UPI003C2B31E0